MKKRKNTTADEVACPWNQCRRLLRKINVNLKAQLADG
jgi:hypothetical protein